MEILRRDLEKADELGYEKHGNTPEDALRRIEMVRKYWKEKNSKKKN